MRTRGAGTGAGKRRNVRDSVRALLVSAAACLGCHQGSSDFPFPDVARTAVAPPMPAAAVAAGPAIQPSGYFLLSQERLTALRSPKGRSGKEWDVLRANVDSALTSTDPSRTSPQNLALAYLLTSDVRYAQAAFAWEHRQLTTADVADDSYLKFGALLRDAAFVLNYCAQALDDGQKKELIDYLEKWPQELWFGNKGTGWGLKDPGNNYFMAFLEGTAFAGYALQAANRPVGGQAHRARPPEDRGTGRRSCRT